MQENNNNSQEDKKDITIDENRKKQQQTDPQITELKGFFDKKEKLEPDLEPNENNRKEEKP